MRASDRSKILAGTADEGDLAGENEMAKASSPNRNEQLDTPQPADKAIDRVLTLLDAEIEDVRSEYERPGWTKWALLGAIGSALWLIAEIVEQGGFQATNVAILFLVFSLLSDALLFLLGLLEPSQARSTGEGRFRLANRWLGMNRAALLLALGHVIAVIVIAYSSRAYFFRPLAATVHVVYVVYGVSALGLVVLLAVSWFPYPIPRASVKTPLSAIYPLAMVLGSLMAAAACGYRVFTETPTKELVKDSRIAALLLVLYYLLHTLAKLRRPTAILDSLITTRRDVVLERIEIDTAIHQIDIALAGLQVSDVLHEDIRGLLEVDRALGAEMEEAGKKLGAIRATVERVKAEEEADEHSASILNSLFESMASHVEKGSEIISDALRRRQRFSRRVRFLASSSKEARPAIVQVLDEVDAAFDEARSRYDRFKEELLEARENGTLRVLPDESGCVDED